MTIQYLFESHGEPFRLARNEQSSVPASLLYVRAGVGLVTFTEGAYVPLPVGAGFILGADTWLGGAACPTLEAVVGDVTGWVISFPRLRGLLDGELRSRRGRVHAELVRSLVRQVEALHQHVQRLAEPGPERIHQTLRALAELWEPGVGLLPGKRLGSVDAARRVAACTKEHVSNTITRLEPLGLIQRTPEGWRVFERSVAAPASALIPVAPR